MVAITLKKKKKRRSKEARSIKLERADPRSQLVYYFYLEMN
jgi:hypothetical protein